ncbi:DMT family transporter [Pseudidiomarina gelatinasegens]|uniref:DMT family transporter n=1 Tax=Pseudidiomarina gelatinasegens TaxID=2487740 RepID=UPI003A96D512
MMKTAALFLIALFAFAGNSVIARYALLEPAIDPASFIIIRILSGAVTLWILLTLLQQRTVKSKRSITTKGSWWGALMLSVYAIAFSYAYVELETGFGALVLFAAVQLTMLGVNISRGVLLTKAEWVGCIIAFGGLAYLVVPTISVPDSLLASITMIMAGSAWGFYSLHGRGRVNPLADTTYNFVRAAPIVIVALLFALPDAAVTSEGILLAVLSGSVTSGLGYAVWYLVLPRLSVTTAAIGQLSVPLIAAYGGVLFAGELFTRQLVIAASLIIGGILIVSWKNKPR